MFNFVINVIASIPQLNLQASLSCVLLITNHVKLLPFQSEIKLPAQEPRNVSLPPPALHS